MFFGLHRHFNRAAAVDRERDCVWRTEAKRRQGVQDGRDSEGTRIHGGELGGWEGRLCRRLAVQR